MDTGVDAKNFIHMPLWAKLLCLGVLGIGILGSVGVMVRFFGDQGSNRDWLLIGFSGGQFLITTFVIATVLFVSQTDANIANLRDRSEHFLQHILPEALGRITLDEENPGKLVARPGKRRDIFGYEYGLWQGDREVLRLWCGVNVHRLIVIYRVVDPVPGRAPADFAAQLADTFAFTFGGAKSVGYKTSIEPLPGAARTVSMWLTAKADPDFLTNPTLKLFWAQDIAMMTESLLRTALRRPDAVLLDLKSRPRPQ